MTLGMILLVAVAVLILFGTAQRVLDRLRLSDRMALVLVAAIFVGGWIPNIPLGGGVSINIGGAIIPIALCVYLFVKAGTGKERFRAIAASVLSAVAVYLLGRFLPSEPETGIFDANYAYGLAAGLIAYLMGRSRRSAFIGGVMGVLLADIAQAIITAANGVPVNLKLGGGGAFDAVVLSGLLAVLLAEVVGEIRERIQRGTREPDKVFVDGEFRPRDGHADDRGRDDKMNHRDGKPHDPKADRGIDPIVYQRNDTAWPDDDPAARDHHDDFAGDTRNLHDPGPVDHGSADNEERRDDR